MNKLTIILLIKGRPLFTKRWLEYANRNLKNFNIIIADGSEEIDKYEIDESCYPNINICQITFPFDKDIKTFQIKIIKALNSVSTQYVCMMSNDDFIFQDSILNQIKFLDNNPDYSASRGDVFDFAINSLDAQNQLYGDIYSILRLYHPIGYNNNDTLKRLRDYKNCPNSLWHSIVRTKILKEIINRSIENNISCNQIFEVYVSLMILISGKYYFDNSLYLLHQVHKEMQTVNKDFLSFEHEVKIFPHIFDNFTNSLTNFIGRQEKEDTTVLKKNILTITKGIKRKPIKESEETLIRNKIKLGLVQFLKKSQLLEYLSIKLKNKFFRKKTEYEEQILLVRDFLN